jgi:hypothetical protein
MPRVIRTCRCFALIVILGACQTVRVTPIDPAPRPFVAIDSVRLFYSVEAVPFRYDEVALLDMEADWLTEDREHIYRALREKAGRLGANAVIVAPIEEPSKGQKVASVLVTRTGYRGKAMAVFLHLADTVATPR